MRWEFKVWNSLINSYDNIIVPAPTAADAVVIFERNVMNRETSCYRNGYKMEFVMDIPKIADAIVMISKNKKGEFCLSICANENEIDRIMADCELFTRRRFDNIVISEKFFRG